MVSGAGLAEILDDARAPKGSLYHHFPGGKEDLAIAALERVSDGLLALISRQRAKGRRAADVVRAMSKGIGPWLVRTSWRERGIISALADGAAPETPRLRAALGAAQTARVEALALLLASEGASEPGARAAFAFAALDGAMLQARLARDTAPILSAAAWVAQILDAR